MLSNKFKMRLELAAGVVAALGVVLVAALGVVLVAALGVVLGVAVAGAEPLRSSGPGPAT